MSARLRPVAAALGALVLLTLGACSAADTEQVSTSATTQTGSAGSGSDVALPGSSEPATADSSSTDPAGATGSIAPRTELPAAAAPATTEVPAPGGGNINETVAEVELTTNAPVALSATGAFGDGVTVTLPSLQRLTTSAALPGEIAGPGVAVTVRIDNSGGAAVDLGSVVVGLQDAAGTPALPMTTSPAAPLHGSVAAGSTASGVYVFTLPTGYSGPATITVSYRVEAPIVVFTGDVG